RPSSERRGKLRTSVFRQQTLSGVAKLLRRSAAKTHGFVNYLEALDCGYPIPTIFTSFLQLFRLSSAQGRWNVKIFNKTFSEYFAFQRAIMILILAVGFTRLLLSLAGVSDSIAKWFSLTALAVVGIFYCAVQVPRTGFGGYKHLLPLYWMQAATGNLIIAGGIALSAITGTENIFSRPEYSGPMASNPWLHAAGHLADGFIIGPLIGWLLGAIIMFVVLKVSRPKAVGIAAAR